MLFGDPQLPSMEKSKGTHSIVKDIHEIVEGIHINVEGHRRNR